jgi:hypothetical protein
VRFVLGNRILTTVGGTEVHLLTLGRQLQRLGHEVCLYAPELGAFADHAVRQGLDVRGNVRRLPEHCDVAFSQDGIVFYDLAARYPDAISVFRVCGDLFDFQTPPQLPAGIDLIVVLSDRYERLARACAVDVPILRLRLPVDMDRLVPSGPLRARPEIAVLLGNYGNRNGLVADAWRSHGIEVRQVGGSNQSFDIADALRDADIVVAKSRAAVDAMACGRAVYVLDFLGGDGWVTPETYPALEADHFAGQAIDRVIDARQLVADLGGYTSEMGAVNRDLAVQHHDARAHTVALLNALSATKAGPRIDAPLAELGRLTAMAWSWEEVARDYRARVWAAHSQAERARGDAARLRAELDAIRGSRSWRFVTTYARARSRLARGPSSRSTPDPNRRSSSA